MADNIIKRIIQLVLDKESADKTQSDANAVAAGVEKAWKNMAEKVAGYLSVAFLTDKIISLGKAAVAQASQSQAAWAQLRGTVESTGASFDGIQAKVRGMADAFQDATIHDDDAFAESLNRMVALTGDVDASLNNMGLVANVAAQYFKGDLGPATDLVAKAMNGNTNALRKMGITAKDANDALNILATRSMGAATREAQSFDGQLKQMGNTWDDVLKTVGEAIINSDGATDAFSVLRAALQTLGDWVEKNKDQISDWVTKGVAFAIDAADYFIRAVSGMANILTGGFMSAIGLAAVGIGKLIGAWGAVREVEDNIRDKLGQDVTKRRELTKQIQENAKALEEWGKNKFNESVDKVNAGIDRLSNRLFTSEQFMNRPASAPGKLPGGSKPQVGANAVTQASADVQKALDQFKQDAASAEKMSAILGDRFDATAAEIDRTTKVLNVLAANGIDPASVGLGDLGSRLNDLVTNIKPTEDATKALAKAFNTDMVMSAVQATSAVDQLKQQQSEIANAMKSLLDAGVDPTSQGIQDLTDRYIALGYAIEDASKIQALVDVFKALGDEINTNLFMATLDGATGLDKMRIQQQALQKAIQTLISQGIDKEDKALKDLVHRYKDVSKAIQEQTLVMQLQAAAADFLADALGTALQGGLHEAATQKAKQNAIEAAEMLVRAGAFALFGDFGHAGAALALAGQFAGIAAAWGLLAAASPGSSSGGAATVPSTGGGSSPSADLSSSRSSSNDAASRSEQPSAEVSVYLVGPGFDALNPEVQKVVWGAQQMAEERYGPNARVRVRSSR